MMLKQDNKAVGRVDPAIPPPSRAMCVQAVSFLYIARTVTTKGSGVHDIVKRGQGYGDAILYACWAIVRQEANKVIPPIGRTATRSLVSLLDDSRKKISSTRFFLGHEDAGMICNLTEPAPWQIKTGRFKATGRQTTMTTTTH